MTYPSFLRIRQTFDRPQVADIPAAVHANLERLELAATIRPGQTVCLTAGSRGITNIPLIIKCVADYLKRLGARPFIIPAMGSHAGGTANGQRQLLESYGITENFVGVPIHASMDVVSLGDTPEGYPVVLDRHAREADHIGVIARVKPHTGFQGAIESGLLKMMMIGLGKHEGAKTYHRLLIDEPWDQVVRSVSRVIRGRAPIAFGIALVENAYDDTAVIEAVRPERFEEREERLLVQAKEWLAKLPFRQADLLIIDEIGKDISGSGMDTNVVGRKRAFRTQPWTDQPSMRHIFIRGLSANTHGNAAGIGVADFTTTRLIRSMDYQATVINCLTAGYPEGANLPVHFDTDRETIDAALSIIGSRTPEQARVMHIRNTLDLEEVNVSQACLEETRATKFDVVNGPEPIRFDKTGNLAPVK